MARFAVPRTVGSLVLASTLALSYSAVAQTNTAPNPADTFEQANQLLERGKVLHARELLRDLMRDTDASLTDRERQRGYGLLTLTQKKVRKADPIELEYERAELALARGDFADADKHARTYLMTADNPGDAVQKLLDEIDRRRAQAPSAPVADAASLGVMQAGVVRRNQDQPAVEPIENGQVSDPDPIEPLADTPRTDLVDQARRVQAQDTLAQANRAFAEARFNEARMWYNRLLSQSRPYLTAEQIRQAEINLSASQTNLNADITGDITAQETIPGRELARQAASAEYNNLRTQAETARTQGNYGAARDYATQARLKVTQARDLFSAAEIEAFNTEIDAMLAAIELEREQALIAENQAQLEAIAEESEKQSEAQRRSQDRLLREQVKRIRALQEEQKYDEALQIVDQILFIKPNDEVGLLLRDVISNNKLYSEYEIINRQRFSGYSSQVLENLEATIAPPSIVNYPSDWPQISHIRGESLAEAEPLENRRVLAVLDQKRIPDVNFRDNTLRDVVAFVQTISQLNIDVDWGSLEEISIDPDTPISLSLKNVPLRTLLDRLMDKVSAGGFGDKADWAVVDGVLTIASDEQIRQNKRLQIYDLRDLVVEVPDFADAPEIDLNSVLQSGGGGGGGGQSPFQNVDDADRERRPLDERLQDIIDIIVLNIDPDGWEDNGGTTGIIQQLNGLLIVTNTPKNHRAIQGLLSQLRQERAMQINVETRFLLVSQDFFEQIGFDIDVYLDAENNQIRTAQISDPSVQASDFFTFDPTRVDPAAPGLGLRRTVTGPGIDTDGDGNVDQFNTQAVVAPNRTSPTAFEGNSLGLVNTLAPVTDFSQAILGGAPALGIAGQFLDDIQVDFLVTATQADRRNVNLTAPRLTVTNGQASNIWVATQVSFVSDLQPVVSDSAVGFDPELDVVSEGVVMSIEGIVSADRRYVTMTVDAAVAEIDGFQTQAVTAVAGGQLVSSADTQSFIQLPTVTVTRVQTTVSVPDQGTILLGGQRLVSESEVETGVPVLSKLPIFNRFFSNRIEVKEESTLLILLKPTILIQNEEEERNFPGLLDSLGGFGG